MDKIKLVTKVIAKFKSKKAILSPGDEEPYKYMYDLLKKLESSHSPKDILLESVRKGLDHLKEKYHYDENGAVDIYEEALMRIHQQGSHLPRLLEGSRDE